MLEYDDFKKLICNELQRNLDREEFCVELKISDADNTINQKRISYLLLIRLDLMRFLYFI